MSRASPFRDTKRVSETDKAALMGRTLQKVYKWRCCRADLAGPQYVVLAQPIGV
jgi:hypothetical protein